MSSVQLEGASSGGTFTLNQASSSQQQQQQQQQQSLDTINGADAAGMHAVAQTSNAILARLKEVEQNNAAMAAAMERLKSESMSKDDKIKELSADKRKEMEQMIDTAVDKWLSSLTGVPDEVRQQFKKGISKIAEQADMKNAAWEIVCNASIAHESNVKKIDELLKTCSEQGETIKTLMSSSSAAADPSFASEASRMAGVKRPRMDLDPTPIPTLSTRAESLSTSGANNNNNNNNNYSSDTVDAWNDFEKMMKTDLASKYF